MSNIVVVTDLFPQISQTFISRQVNWLKARVITRAFDREVNTYFKHTSDSIYVLEEGINKRILTAYKYFKKIKHRLFLVPTYHWYKDFHLLFEKYLLALETKVVLAQFGPIGINCIPVCKKLNIPLVVQFFGYDASMLLSNRYYVRELKNLFDYATTIVVLTDFMREQIRQVGCPAEKIEVINCGVPLEKFKISTKDYDKDFIFLATGRLVEKKSPLHLIKAFEKCADGNEKVKLIIIGNGPLMPTVINYLNNSKHKDKVILMGYQSEEVLKEKYKIAHVFVQHSVTTTDGDTEGWPVAIAEACASGLPVISTKHAGIQEQIIHGETGYLVEERDYLTMGHYMLKLSLDSALCKKMSMLTRAHIEKIGDFTQQAKKLEAVLINVVSQRYVQV